MGGVGRVETSSLGVCVCVWLRFVARAANLTLVITFVHDKSQKMKAVGASFVEPNPPLSAL